MHCDYFRGEEMSLKLSLHRSTDLKWAFVKVVEKSPNPLQ